MITVVLSVYNTGSFLEKSVNALLGQTYRDYEIIIVDDGSTDGSSEICDQQAEGRENIRVFHKSNGGLSSARNLGIQNARGDFIIFPDPDDWVEPRYLEGLVAIREKHGADLSVCGHYVFWETHEEVWNPNAKETVVNTAEALDLLMEQESFCGYAWNKLYSMDVIREHQLLFDVELGMAQDLHFAFRYLQLCEKIAYDPAPLYHYNRNSGGVTMYDSPLTPRKLSGLKTYYKIAELAHGKFPRIESTAYAILSDTCLQYIYMYFHSGMKDEKVLRMLQTTYKEHEREFLASPAYSDRRKKLARLAPTHPRLYYYSFQTKRVVKHYKDALKRKLKSR